MSRTNYGNGYKFQAVMNSRTNKNTVKVQFMKKDGTWEKPAKLSVSDARPTSRSLKGWQA